MALLDTLPVAKWTPEHTCLWLESLGAALGVRQAVTKHGIDGKLLKVMDGAAWSELGLTPLMQAKALVSLSERGGEDSKLSSAHLTGCMHLAVAINVLSVSSVQTVQQQFDS